jgi:hypothetical protein
MVSITIPDDDLDRIDRVARTVGVSRSEYLRECALEGCKHFDGGGPKPGPRANASMPTPDQSLANLRSVFDRLTEAVLSFEAELEAHAERVRRSSST